MNKKIVLLATLTLCITTVSPAMNENKTLRNKTFNNDHDSAKAGCFGSDFGYTNDKKLYAIMRKFYDYGPDESFDYLNEKTLTGLLRLAKMEAFDEKTTPPLHTTSLVVLQQSQPSEEKTLNKPKKTLAKKINPKQNKKHKKKKKIITPLKQWPCKATQKPDNPQIVREKHNFKNKKKKKAWKKEWKKQRKPSQKNQEHS